MALVRLPRGTAIVRTAVLAVALIAGFFTVRSGLAFMLATDQGAAIAVQIDPSNTNALAMDVNERLKTVELGAPAARLAADSKRALAISPIEVMPLRTIGIITAANDDEKGAEKLLNLAARLSLHDYLTHAWLLDYRFRNDQVERAVYEVDILLRQSETNWAVIIPALITLTRDPRITEPLARTLAQRPFWRGIFVTRLGAEGEYPETTFALLSRMKALGSPASKEELDPYFIAGGKRMSPQQLFAQWIALLPPSARAAATGLVRDGDFVGLDASPPFGWRYYPADGVYAERGTGPAGLGRALYVSYAGERQTVFANQQLVLAPGRYRLTGRAYADDAIDKGLFGWSVTCMTKGSESVLGSVPVNPVPGHPIRYAGEFEVPASCDQEQLELNGAPRDASFDTVAMYVDSIAVERLR